MAESDLKELGTGEDIACGDPECAEANSPLLTAEVEVDGDHKYHVCIECGYNFNYQKVEGSGVADDACSIGVPESIRKIASAAPEGAIANLAREESRQSGTVNIGTTIPFGRT